MCYWGVLYPHAMSPQYPYYPDGQKPLVLAPFVVTDGHNNSVWSRARQCQRHGYNVASATKLIDAWLTANAHLFKRAIPSEEVGQQIANAYGYAATPPGPDATPRAKKEKQEQQQESPQLVAFIETAFASFGLDQLKLESPQDKDYCPIDYLSSLFLPARWSLHECEETWVCIGTSLAGMRTVQLKTVLEAGGEHQALQFVVPNPMSRETGITMKGTTGWRTRDNATSEKDRLFYVVEFDYDPQGNPVPKDVQARRLRCLDVFTNGRLALVVDSGGKSLQGWIRTEGLPQREIEVFWKLALAMGADPKGAQPEQAFRAPQGTRYPKTGGGEGKPQSVVYCNTWAGRSSL